MACGDERPDYDQIRFITKIFHCNVTFTGSICVDAPQSNWNGAMTMKWIIMSLIVLLGEPNPGNAMEPEVGQLCLQKKDEYL